MRKTIILLLMASLLVLLGAGRKEKAIHIKLATLAPEGSSPHLVLQNIKHRWEKATKDKVKITIYAGGVFGDESDMVRKMRIGRLHAAAITNEGLSYIHKGVYGLNLPMFVDNFEEMKWLRGKIAPTLEQKMSENGAKVLFWADVGWAYWFSKTPILSPKDLQKTKIFTWAGDAHSVRIWKKAGFKPVPLSAIDILPSLQTGMIESVAAPAIVAAPGQWFAVANNMLDVRWSPMIGAVVISEKAWQEIPKKYHKKLLKIVEEEGANFATEMQKDEQAAMSVMLENGLKIQRADEEMILRWKQTARKFYPLLRGTLVDEIIFDKVMALEPTLDSLRATKP